MRLDKFLCEMGAGSRTQVKEMVRKGQILVNGQMEKKADRKIDPLLDQIWAGGQVMIYTQWEYFLLNKPQGVVSATEDKRYPTVVSLIKDAKRKDLFPVGRLDRDTEGLLLITNDGELAHHLLSPKNHVDKTYFAKVEGILPKDSSERIREGLLYEDQKKALPGELQILKEEQEGVTEVLLTIHEGKFHQVKRMFEALGCQVVYLKRIAMGPLKLEDELAPGQYRPLTKEELQACREEGKR